MERLLRKSVMVLMALALALGAWGRLPVQPVAAAEIVFTESMGTGACNGSTGTTAISVFESNNCYDNDGFTMSGTADMRTTTASSGYSGASGEWNVFITNVADRYFEIADINTTNYNNLALSFGVHKSTTLADGSSLSVQVSENGTDWTTLSVPLLPTGSGTAIWHYRTASGSIPATSNLRIRFTNTNTSTQFRIDDVRLEGDPTAVDLTDFSAVWNGDAVAVSWETAQELDNLGFNLYRGESAAGPWTRLNAELIPPQNPGAVFGATYTWLDENVTPGATYFYRLEDVDIYGVSTFHGPVSTAQVDPSAVALSAFGARGPAFGLPLALAALGLWGLARKRRS